MTGAGSSPRSLVDLAMALARGKNLTQVVKAALPRLASMLSAPIVVFAVADVPIGGAAVFPEDADLVRVLQTEGAEFWEDGLLTRWCRAKTTWTPTRFTDIPEITEIPFSEPRLRDGFGLYVPLGRPGERGLCGYFLLRGAHDFDAEDLGVLEPVQAVLLASHGRFIPDLAEKAVLSPREFEVFELMASGLTATAIGTRLGISVHTVRKHLHNAYERLGTQDRASALSQLWARGQRDLHSETWRDVVFRAPTSRSDEAP